MENYKVTFTGNNGELTLWVDSPLVVDCEHEDNVHTIIDLAIGIGELTFGEDFRDKLDTYAICLGYADEEI